MLVELLEANLQAHNLTVWSKQFVSTVKSGGS